MKKLIIIRHGKATQSFMPDKERFLVDKGKKRTQKFALKLKETGIIPDLILTSPAVRAKQTAEIIAEVFSFLKDKIQVKDTFYFRGKELVYNELYALPDDKNAVFIVGHNPLWTELADNFSTKQILHLRTSGIFGVEFDTKHWTEIETAEKRDLVLISD